jgi:two-component system cell cycle response regulator DivK
MINPSGKHILIVDDYADAVDIWAIYLQSRGYQVSTAADGPTALEKATTLLPDLIILDLELPGLTGFEVAQRLRAQADTSGIPLIAATGYSHARQLDLARQSGFDAVVVKPCDPDMLVQEIERLLASGPVNTQPDHSSVEQPYNNR